MVYHFEIIHGSNIVREGLSLFDSGALNRGDVLQFPHLYRLIFSEQPRRDFYLQLREIESYLCCNNYQ